MSALRQSIKLLAGTVTLYHGVREEFLDEKLEKGLYYPFLVDDPDAAEHWARAYSSAGG